MEPVRTAVFHPNNILNITSPDPVAVIKTAQLGQKMITFTICIFFFSQEMTEGTFHEFLVE